jgi:hypothetical protein
VAHTQPHLLGAGEVLSKSQKVAKSRFGSLFFMLL